MPIQTFPEILVVDEQGNAASGATVQAFNLIDTSYSTPLSVTDLNGLPLTMVSNSRGMVQAHRVNAVSGVVVYKSGTMPPFARISLDYVVSAGEDAADSALAAAAAQIQAQATADTVAALQKWIELGITRRNEVRDPRATTGSLWSAQFGTGGAGSGVSVTGASDGPTLPDGSRAASYFRMTWTAATTSGSAYTYVRSPDGAGSWPLGTSVALAFYARPSVSTPARVSLGVRSGGATAGASTLGTWGAALPAGQWSPVGQVLTTSSAADGVGIYCWIQNASAFGVGATLDVTCVMIAPGSTDLTYFDGSVASTQYRANRWSGAAHASVSEQLDMTQITAIPPGGEPGQSLVKVGVEDWATAWATVTGGGGGSGIVGAPAVWPSAFPSSAHSHPRSQISDASTLGRSLLGAADAQAARALIGAGTGNGTSDLTLGTAGTQAAPGNHAHSASAVEFVPTGTITASNVQDAIAQAAQSGGGTGSSAIFVWKFNAGAYPTLPVTMPTGTLRVEAEGPISPLDSGAVIRSWIGPGPGKATLYYQYNPTLS